MNALVNVIIDQGIHKGQMLAGWAEANFTVNNMHVGAGMLQAATKSNFLKNKRT